MNTAEKVAYLRGLADGFGLAKDSKESQILSNVLDILEDMAHDISDLEQNSWELGEAIDQVSEDLEELEDYVYELELDDDDCCDDDCCCGACCADDYDDEDDEEPVFYEVTCAACDNTITVDEDVMSLGTISCPACGEPIDFDAEDEE